MRFIIIIIALFFFNTTHAGEGLFWSNIQDGPATIEEAKKIFKNKKMDPIEGIWFYDGFTSVIFKSGDNFREYIISVDGIKEKIFEKTWEATLIKISDNNYSFFNRVWYFYSNGSLKETLTQSGILKLIGKNFFEKEYFELSKGKRNMNQVQTKVWPVNNENFDSQSDGGDKKNNIHASGTAFFINKQGYLVTNYHVIEGCKNINISNSNYSSKVSILAIDKINDLAVLNSKLNNTNYLKITDKKIKKLQKIIAAGYPFGKSLSDDLKFTSGIISSLKGFDNNSSQIQIDAALNPGSSGGPIIDEETGELIGVAVSILRKDVSEGINFAIKAGVLNNFLNSNGIVIDNIPENSNDILKNIELSTLSINCD